MNDTLQTSSAALTDLVVVNDFSEKKEKAADFAEYVTLTMSGELHGLGGHYSVKLSEDADEKEQIAYQAYENAIPVPIHRMQRILGNIKRNNISIFLKKWI